MQPFRNVIAQHLQLANEQIEFFHIRRVASDLFKAGNRTVARLENETTPAPGTGGTR